MARVVLERLTKAFAGAGGQIVPALNELSLTIEEGELLTVLGPSGGGKTTLLRLIAGLENPDAGTITLAGRPMKGVAAKDRDVAMVFQNQALYPHLTAYENLAFGLKLRRIPPAEIERRIDQAAQILNLSGCLGRKPGELSGGERQRVAVGRAIVRQAGLLLLDEPLSQLDEPLRAQLRTELARVHRQLKATMIYVTHDQLEAMTLGTRLAVLRGGELQQAASPLEVYQRPANQFVAGFIGSPAMKFISGALSREAGGHYFRSGPISGLLPEEVAARLSHHEGKALILGIRPEHIFCGPAALPSRPAANCNGEVEFIERRGAETMVHLRCSGGTALVARTASDLCVRLGETIALSFEFSAAHFFDPATGAAVG